MGQKIVPTENCEKDQKDTANATLMSENLSIQEPFQY